MKVIRRYEHGAGKPAAGRAARLTRQVPDPVTLPEFKVSSHQNGCG